MERNRAVKDHEQNLRQAERDALASSSRFRLLSRSFSHWFALHRASIQALTALKRTFEARPHHDDPTLSFIPTPRITD